MYRGHACQVTDEMEVTRALDLARVEFGSCPSVAVNCAGIGYAKRTISRCVPYNRRMILCLVTARVVVLASVIINYHNRQLVAVCK